MKILFWNCRGLGKATAVQALKGLIQKHSPGGVFLGETKAKNTKMEKLRNILGFDKSEMWEANGWK